MRCTEVETGARNIDFILKGKILPMLSNGLLDSMANSSSASKARLDLDASGEFTVSYS
jgi:type VI secretion system protein VasG